MNDSFAKPLAAATSAGESHFAGVRLFLLLDFDGVFNSFHRSTLSPKLYFPVDRVQRHPNPDFDPTVRHRGPSHLREPRSYELRWSSELVEGLNVLLSSPAVAPVWLTTWRQHMGGVMERLGVESAVAPRYLPWESAPTDPFSHYGKFQAASAFSAGAAPGSSFIWLDDVLFDSGSLKLTDARDLDELLRSHVSAGLSMSNTLPLAPNGGTGVSRADWAAVSEFARLKLD